MRVEIFKVSKGCETEVELWSSEVSRRCWILTLFFPPTGDETYQDIFQDFTHMASNDPEKLNRYQQYDPQRP